MRSRGVFQSRQKRERLVFSKYGSVSSSGVLKCLQMGITYDSTFVSLLHIFVPLQLHSIRMCQILPLAHARPTMPCIRSSAEGLHFSAFHSVCYVRTHFSSHRTRQKQAHIPSGGRRSENMWDFL